MRKKPLAIVQVRGDGSSAGLKIGRKLGGKSLLEWVVRRVTDCQRLDGVAVVLSGEGADRVLGELVPPDVPTFFAPQPDALARFAAAAQHFGAEAVVRVCAENPYVDPLLIDRLVRTADQHQHSDYISYRSRSGQPAVLSPLGLLSEWCSTAALQRAARDAVDPDDRRDVTSFFYRNPQRFTVRLLPVPPELDRDDLRLKIDLEEDWEHAQVIHDALGSDEWDWRQLAGLLDHQPKLRQRMAALNRSAAAAV